MTARLGFLGRVARATPIFVAVAAAVALQATRNPIGLATGDEAYSEILHKTMVAVDRGYAADFGESAWNEYKRNPSPTTAFASGVASMYGIFLLTYGQLGGTRSAWPSLGHEYLALKAAKDGDGKSAYPLLLYAWYVSQWREPGLRPEPIYEDLGQTTLTGQDGKPVAASQKRLIADPAKDKRVKELLAKAAEIAPRNPLLLYLRSTLEVAPAEKRRLLWESLGSPGTKIWEFGALSALRRIAGGDKDELQRIRDWVARAKAIVGDSPRAKANGF